MAIALCVACALLVGLAIWNLLAEGESGLSLVRIQVIVRLAKQGVEAVATSRLVELLMGVDAFAEVVSRLGVRLPESVCRSSRDAAGMLVVVLGAACIAGGILAQSLLGVGFMHAPQL